MGGWWLVDVRFQVTIGGEDLGWVQLLAPTFDVICHLCDGPGGSDSLVCRPVVITVGELLGGGAEVIVHGKGGGFG